MRLSIALATILSCACLSTPAQATDIYFHRAGASWDQYQADVANCTWRVRNTQANTSSAPGSVAAAAAGSVLTAGILGGIIAGVQVAVELPRQRRRNMSYCMATHGWDTVEIDNLPHQANAQAGANPLLDERIKPWFAEPALSNGHAIFGPQFLTANDVPPPPVFTLQQARAEDAERRRRLPQ